MQPHIQNKLQNNSLNCTSYILRIHITQSDVPLQIYTLYPPPDLTGAARQLTGLPTDWGAKTSLEYRVLVNSRFHTPKNFRTLSEIWVRALTQAALSRKNLNNVGLHGRQIVYLPGAPTSLGLVLAVTSYSGVPRQHPDYNKTTS